jgi:hypothetical protein
MPLAGAERKQILKIIHDGITTRPKVPNHSDSARILGNGSRSSSSTLPDDRTRGTTRSARLKKSKSAL